MSGKWVTSIMSGERTLASILVSRGSAKYFSIDSRADAITSSGIPLFVTAHCYWQASTRVGEYLTVEEANVYACVSYLLCKSLLNIGLWIGDVLQVSGDR